MAERKSKRTDAVIERIVAGLSDGIPLRQLCREDGMPSARAVYDWMAQDAELASRIAHARDVGFDAIAESVFDIIDDCPAISDHVQRAKMRAEYRLKLLAKWSPKRYGDKQTHSIGGDPDAPAVAIEQTGVAPDVLAELTKALLAKQ